jgi:hypothetical protein
LLFVTDSYQIRSVCLFLDATRRNWRAIFAYSPHLI